jgi:hypothetical protein
MTLGRRQLFDGRFTAEEAHAMFAFPRSARCAGCGSRGLALRAIVMAPLDEAVKHRMIDPESAKDPYRLASILIPIQESATSRKLYVRISITYCCRRCQREFERALAKAPSWCIVEINRGPGADKIVSMAEKVLQ